MQNGVTFWTEGGQSIGMGHVMRCINIARAFGDEEMPLHFLVNNERPVIERLNQEAFFHVVYPMSGKHANRLTKGVVLIDTKRDVSSQVRSLKDDGKKVVLIDNSSTDEADATSCRRRFTGPIKARSFFREQLSHHRRQLQRGQRRRPDKPFGPIEGPRYDGRGRSFQSDGDGLLGGGREERRALPRHGSGGGDGANILAARDAQDSVGGVVEVVARGVPAGWGDPTMDKLDAVLAHALMSIPAVKGVEIGDGFALARARGSQANHALDRGGFSTSHQGGILGGISTGQDVVARLAVKPASSIARPQATVDASGAPATIAIEGRHDPCICPRVVPVAEAMLCLVLVDAWLVQRALRGA